MVETFYNSPKALRAIRFITTVLPSPFAFFQQLGLFWEEKGYRAVNHNRAEYSRLFYEFCTTQQPLTPFLDIIADLLRFDLCLGDNAKRLPQSLQWDTPDIREARSRFYHDRKQIESLLPYLAGYTPHNWHGCARSNCSGMMSAASARDSTAPPWADSSAF